MKSKVVLLPCGEYKEEKIYTLLKQGLDFLGGLETLIPKGAKILLKPNLLKKAEVEKAVITHPVVVGAFARILRENGYEHIVLADSCGHGTTQAVIRGTGMDTYLEKYHIPAIDYSEGVKTVYPQGIQAKEFILPKELLEQDCVISLSKMKTHALERITGAVKNSYGFVYGFHKAKGHTQYPSADSFARMLIDLNKCVSPKLYVMDGIVAMEGNGPRSCSHECNADVYRPGCAGQRVQSPGLPETGNGSDELSRREDGTWNLEGRGDHTSDTGGGDFHGRGSETVRKSRLQCRPYRSTQKYLDKNGRGIKDFPEEAIYRN